jgi:hypothetical protein
VKGSFVRSGQSTTSTLTVSKSDVKPLPNTAIKKDYMSKHRIQIQQTLYNCNDYAPDLTCRAMPYEKLVVRQSNPLEAYLKVL